MFKAFPLGHEIIRIYTDMTLDASKQSFAGLKTVVAAAWDSKAEENKHNPATAASACATLDNVGGTGLGGMQPHTTTMNM